MGSRTEVKSEVERRNKTGFSGVSFYTTTEQFNCTATGERWMSKIATCVKKNKNSEDVQSSPRQDGKG
jgi:hypothetical protein